MTWTTPTALRQQVAAWWDKGLILAEPTVFPRRLTLKTPTSREISEQFEAVRRWAQALLSTPHVRFVERDFRHRLFGDNRLPAEAWIDNAEAAIALLGKRREAGEFAQIWTSTVASQPQLLPWLQKRPLHALQHAADWPKLLAVVAWLLAQPRPNIYLRQIDLPGIDSKFVEARRSVLSELLDLALPVAMIESSATGLSGFNRRYGFRDKPERIRCRFLDPDCAPQAWLATADLTLDAAAFARLNPAVDRVFMTENEVNFLAFPAVARSLLIFGAGYGFNALDAATWLAQKRIYYWGDIDTHGFAILDQLRSHFPQVCSLLMDEPTLQACRAFWGTEPNPTQHPLSRLTPAENAVYQALGSQQWAPALRLEQERIPLSRLHAILPQLP